MRVRPEWKGIDDKLQAAEGGHADRMFPFFQPKGAKSDGKPNLRRDHHRRRQGGGEKGVSVICVIMDAPGTAVSALSGKLGMLAGVSAKTVTAKV